MKKTIFSACLIFVIAVVGCETGDPTETEISSEQDCQLCEKTYCKKQLDSCNQFDLCKRFDVCIEETNSSCDECKSDKDLIYGFPAWKELADCNYYNCSLSCSKGASLSCSN